MASIEDEQPESREALYKRISASSRDAVIREEMIKHGFWKPDEPEPKLAEEWFSQRSGLVSELNKLLTIERRYTNPEQALIEIHRQRKEDSKKRRLENRAKREEARKHRAAEWKSRKTQEILFLGEEVSAGLLSKVGSDAEKLGRYQLPVFPSPLSLARVMQIPIGELRFLAFNRRVSKVTHYRRFEIPKKTGGTRLISAPMPRLKAAQRWILEQILNKVPIHANAHGFLQKRSIVTNALPHVGAEIVINMDLKDFFPTITYRRIKGVFRNLGYSEPIAIILGLLCSEPDVQPVELDGQTYYVAEGERHLPQGAPTSPAITNILAYRMDRRLSGISDKLGCRYTRYADDLTFSGPASLDRNKLLWRVKSVIMDESLVFHPDKLRVMRKGERQEVTGLTVNGTQPAVNRTNLRKFRALLFQLERDGVQKCHWNGKRDHLLATVLGYAHFVKMVNPEKGAALMQQVKPLLDRHGYKHEIRHPAKPKAVVTPPPLDEPKQLPPPLPAKPTAKTWWERLLFWK